MTAATEAQREADEILRHVTADLRARAVSLEDWWRITHRAIMDGYLSEMEAKIGNQSKEGAQAQSGDRGLLRAKIPPR